LFVFVTSGKHAQDVSSQRRKVV